MVTLRRGCRPRNSSLGWSRRYALLGAVSGAVTHRGGRLATAFVPGLGIAPPAMGIVPFEDHPSVLLQLRGVEHLEQGLGHPLDQPRLEVRGQPALEQLHANERHLRGRCRLRHAFHCAGNGAPA